MRGPLGLRPASKQKIELLNGCEVQSLKHEGCVSILKDKVYLNGEVIETLDTNQKVNYLFKLYLKQEGF
jgi:hypothetical protein